MDLKRQRFSELASELPTALNLLSCALEPLLAKNRSILRQEYAIGLRAPGRSEAGRRMRSFRSDVTLVIRSLSPALEPGSDLFAFQKGCLSLIAAKALVPRLQELRDSLAVIDLLDDVSVLIEQAETALIAGTNHIPTGEIKTLESGMR